MPERIKLDHLNALSAGDFVAALANIVEHSPWIAKAIETARPFSSLAAMRDAMVAEIENAPPEERLALIRSHPDLANKTQRAEGLTADSVTEQDGAGLDRLSEAEFALFAQRNDAYKEKFGFPFILCVRRHTKDSILDVFARRLKNAPAAEAREAIAEICRIATLRLDQQVAAEHPLRVHGRLSTHVLDTHSGRPAAGVALELIELSRLGENRVIVRTATNSDGRTENPLIHGRPVPIGVYELQFGVGAYFSRRGVAVSEPPFLDIVSIRFGVSEPESHLHVPLLVSPFSYTTYRGS